MKLIFSFINQSIKSPLGLLLLLLIVFTSLISCYTKKDVSRKLAQESVTTENEVIEEEDIFVEEEDIEGYDVSSQIQKIVKGKSQESIENQISDNSLIRSIQRALNQGQYERVIELSQREESDLATYYRGIAYYIMMVETTEYSDSERGEFRRKAMSILRKIGYQSKNAELRARSLLWYGITAHVSYEDLFNKKKAIAALYEFERSSSLRNTPYFNDALYYSGLIYMQMGWFGVARGYFKRVANANGVDNEIYDYEDNRYYRLTQASQIGLEKLESYMDGTHPNYR